MEIRAFEEGDWPQVWRIVEPVVRKGDTFCYDPHLTEAQAYALWVVRAPGHVAVAVEDDVVLGTTNMYANRPGPGAHVASGNFMVAPDSRGRGVGHAMGAYLLDWARSGGFAGVQFNAVAASNLPAVRLYERLGFTVVGTVPGAFRHPDEGPVGLHVMFHDLGA